LDLKLIEDLVALQAQRSFVRAAQVRHVTHPAFGRRIRALEAWAGVPLVDRTRQPVQLTAEGLALIAQAEPLVAALAQTRAQWQAQVHAPRHAVPLLRVGTGRTLARTLVADWLARSRRVLRGARVELHTRSMQEIAAMFERGEVDLLCCYDHPALSIRLSPQRFRYVTLAGDRLVPVVRASNPKAATALDDAPLIAYAPTLSLGRLLQDHWARTQAAADGRTTLVCDSADAMHELAAKGLGLAWLPWSLVAADCKRGLLRQMGGRSEEVHFEVRLYRPRARQSALVETIWAASDR
jgi:LysR family transcriptional regulator, hypochlorite-specific transcription factor HypT